MSTPNEKIDERLLDLLYGELDPETAAQLEAEIKTDPVLRERFESWSTVRRAMADLPEPEPDPQVHYEILRAARAAVEKPEKKGFLAWLTSISLNPAFAVLGLAVLGGAAWLALSRGFRDSDPVSAPTALEGAAERAVEAEKDAPPDPRAADPMSASGGVVDTPMKATLVPPADQAGASAAPGTLALEGELLDGKQSLKDMARAEAPALELDKAPGGDGWGGLEASNVTRRSKGTGGLGRAATAEPPAAPKRKAAFAPPPPERRERGDSGYVDEIKEESKVAEKQPAEGGAAKEGLTKAPTAGPAPFPAEQPVVVGGDAPPQAGDVLEAPAREAAGEGQALPKTEALKADLDAKPDPAPRAEMADVAEAPAEAEEVSVGNTAVDDSVQAAPPVVQAEPPADADGETFNERVVRALDAPSGQAAGGAGPPRPDVQANRRAEAARRPAAVSDRDANDEGPPPALMEARSAQQRGDHLAAVEAYNRYFNGYRSDDQFAAAMLEAARSYEALGDIPRALQLYKLAAAGTDAQVAQKARTRVGALESLKKAKTAEPAPVNPMLDDLERPADENQAEPAPAEPEPPPTE